MCHELRNPLHAISASTSFLLEAMDAAHDVHNDLHAITMAAEQMHRIVNDVLDWNKLRAGKIQIRPKVFPVRYVTWCNRVACPVT